MLQSSPTPTSTNVFVAKFDGLTGTALWAKQLPTNYGYAVTTDGDGIYVLDSFSGIGPDFPKADSLDQAAIAWSC